MIQMVDLKTQYQRYKQEIDDAVSNVLDSCQFILGPNVQALEKEVAEYANTKHALSCASGTDALHLAIRAAGSRNKTSCNRRQDGQEQQAKDSLHQFVRLLLRCNFCVVNCKCAICDDEWLIQSTRKEVDVTSPRLLSYVTQIF